MDQLINDVMSNFERELKLYKKNDPACLFNKLMERQNVPTHKLLKTEDDSIVIGNRRGLFIVGFSIIKYFNNTFYIGDMQDNLREGFGHRSYVSTDVLYVGDYLQNLKCGKGKLWSHSKQMWVFDGHWHNDMKNGYGELWRSSGVFKGNWVDDRMEGIGHMTWTDGQTYEGEYSQDQRQGKGTMTYVNGDSYTGTFKAGKPHGTGYYQWANGEIYEGNWTDGTMDGNGTLEYQLPVRAMGSFKMGSSEDINFDLQSKEEWGDCLAKSSMTIKSYRSTVIPESSRVVWTEENNAHNEKLGVSFVNNSNGNGVTGKSPTKENAELKTNKTVAIQGNQVMNIEIPEADSEQNTRKVVAIS